ncbi:MAG: ABC transporter permease [Actinobacteria bacterium]|nr:ABC transporter permease [Actinomycetota bacterium]
MGSRGYVARKLVQAGFTLAFVLTFNFFLFRVLPGDPVGLLAKSQRLTEADVAGLRAELGLDQPIGRQYLTYVGQTLTGNLGVSLRTARDVTATIWSRIGPTVLLVGLGTLFSTVIGIWIGIKGGWRRGSRFDTSTLYGSLALYSIPEGWLGMLLLLALSGALGLFPAGGFELGGRTGTARFVDVLDHLFLPVLTLTLGYVGQYAIIMRSSMIDVLGEEYVTSARAKGVPEHLVRRRHVVPNAFLPTFTLTFLNFGFVLGGAIVVEAVFSWPGLGLLTYEAINQLDFPVIQGVFLVSSAAVVVFNLLADVTYGYLDPRVRAA